MKISDVVKEQCVEMYTQGAKLSDIRAELGIYDTQIYTILAEHGVELRGTKKSSIAETTMEGVVEDYKAGKRIIDIAVERGVQPAQIYRILAQSGVNHDRRGQTRVQHDKAEIIRKMYVEDKLPIYKICVETGCSPATIYRLIDNNNWPRRRKGEETTEFDTTLEQLKRAGAKQAKQSTPPRGLQIEYDAQAVAEGKSEARDE